MADITAGISMSCGHGIQYRHPVQNCSLSIATPVRAVWMDSIVGKVKEPALTEFMVLSTSDVLLIPAIMVVVDGLDIRYLIPRSAADTEPDFFTS